MPSVYLVSKDAAPFPYEAVKTKITGLPEVTTGQVDFNTIIEDGIKSQWPPELVEKQRQLQASGKCFTFEQGAEPRMSGTVYLDNAYFIFDDEPHYERCKETIEGIADELGLKVSIGFAE